MKERWTVVPAVYVLLRKDNRILLATRTNTGYRDGWFSLPAGHLDGAESAIQAAVREVKEEVGVRVTVDDLRFVHVAHRLSEEGSHERIDIYFETTKWNGEPRIMESDKCDELRWVSMDNLPDNTIPVVRGILEKIHQGVLYSDVGFSS
jgi:8-oxo-dGTP diphosphatase